MITPEDFVAKWTKDEPRSALVRFESSSVEGVGISEVDKRFLIDAGLPKSAAPFLAFDGPSAGSVPTVAGVYNLSDEFSHYRVIGDDGGGNPICIDVSRNASIVILNHDDNFEPYLLNSSVPQLAESLLTYRDLMRQVVAIGGGRPFHDIQVPIRMQNWIKAEFERIDPATLEEGCLWRDTIDELQLPWFQEEPAES